MYIVKPGILAEVLCIFDSVLVALMGVLQCVSINGSDMLV